MKPHIVFVTIVIAFCFSGCESTPEQLYSWGSYEPQVYAHLNKESSPYDQLGVLELELQKIAAEGKRVPPGLFAHMGMLHADIGNFAGASAYFMNEKTLFPESAVFMDYLLEQLGSSWPAGE